MTVTKKKLDELHELVVSNGVAMVKDYSTGTGHSVHPSIAASGSVRGMKDRGYWRRDDKIVSAHGFKFNVSTTLKPQNKWERIAYKHDKYVPK